MRDAWYGLVKIEIYQLTPAHVLIVLDLLIMLMTRASLPLQNLLEEVPQKNKLRISRLGNVGITTTNPQEKLHVVGNTKIEGELTIYHDTTSILNIDENCYTRFIFGYRQNNQIDNTTLAAQILVDTAGSIK